MPLVLYICLLWLSTNSLYTTQADNPYTNGSSRSPHRRLAPTTVDFAFNLYKHLVALNPEENILIAPASISIALDILSHGPWGHTQSQILQAMGFNLTETPEAEIHQDFQNLYHILRHPDTSLNMKMHTTIFSSPDMELDESFIEKVKNIYDPEFLNISFKEWIKDRQPAKSKTQGKGAQISSDLHSPANLVLFNNNVFKVLWELPFSPESTIEKDFYVGEKSTARVPTMVQSSNIDYLRDSEIPCEVVKMKNLRNVTTFLILPSKGRMNDVIAALNRDTVERWDRLLNKRQMTLYIPKFSMSSMYYLKDVLAAKGIEALFTNQPNSGTSKSTMVVHKTMLHLDESSALPLAPKVSPLHKTPESQVILMLNRPFIILAFDNYSWNSMIMGKITEP